MTDPNWESPQRTSGLGRGCRAQCMGLLLTMPMLALGVASQGFAATLVVDQRGGTPYRSVRAALSDANHGDVVLVRAGVYEEAITLGPGVSDLTLHCDGPDRVVLHNPYGNTITVAQSTTATIVGCTISSTGHGIALRAGSRTTVRNSVVTASDQGITNVEAGVQSLDVINSTIARNARSGIEIDGCGILNTIAATAVINSIVANNGTCGIFRNATANCANPLPVFSYNNFVDNGTNYCGTSAGLGSISLNPGFINPLVGDYRLRVAASSRHAGQPLVADNNPDGSRNDQGAFGGPYASNFPAASGGQPPAASLSLDPAQLAANATLRLQATGQLGP